MKCVVNPGYVAGALEDAARLKARASAKTVGDLLAAHPESQQVSVGYIAARLAITEAAAEKAATDAGLTVALVTVPGGL